MLTLQGKNSEELEAQTTGKSGGEAGIACNEGGAEFLGEREVRRIIGG